MHRSLVPSLPGPLARALVAFLDEELPRSADEISELLTVAVEYVAAVAISDYLDGGEAQEGAADPSLNGWLISQLATGKAEAGHWARWTRMAIGATRVRSVPGLGAYGSRQNLDDPNSDIAWLLAFRNRVMHGGFVAPLPAIRAAVERMTRWFADLSDVFALRVVGRVATTDGPAWRDLRGLDPTPCARPRIASADWDRPGAVLLVDDQDVARLALDPACVVDAAGRLALQHGWQDAHPRLFERRAIASFFGRYQRERRGQVESTEWFERVAASLPARGYVAARKREEALLALLEPGRVVRLVGPTGSGRSTLVYGLAARSERPFAVFAVEPHGVRQDPEVVARFTLQALSAIALGEPMPVDALAADGATKNPEAFARLAAALRERSSPVLVVDDAELVGTGLYAGASTATCLRHARRLGASVLLVHTPAGRPPEPGDASFDLAPLDDDELRDWGEPDELRATSAGHLELLAHTTAGRAALRSRLASATAASALHRRALDALREGPRTVQEVATAVDAFTPAVEFALRALLDHLVVGERESAAELANGARVGRERRARVVTRERTYALHPAVALVLSEVEG